MLTIPLRAGRPRGPRRALPTAALAALLCLGASACGNDLLPGADADAVPLAQPRDHGAKKAEKSVRAFYARANRAFRTRDAATLCAMTQPAYAEAMVAQVAAAGAPVSTCEDVWRLAIAADPGGHRDRMNHLEVRGGTATFRSGDDPWRLRKVRGRWLIVDPR